MKHVVFARDRRKKKFILKSALFATIMLSVLVGIIVTLKNQTLPSVKRQQYITLNQNIDNTSVLQNIAYHTIDTVFDAIEAFPAPATLIAQMNSDELGFVEKLGYRTVDWTFDLLEAFAPIEEEQTVEEGQSDESATSYDDELAPTDDVEEGATAENGKEKLSKEAEEAVQDLIGVAKEAMKIREQFSYTVEQGDKLTDVLEQSGVNPTIAKALIRKYPDLANLSTGQQFYGVVDGDNELEFMNWFVSEKQEQIFTRTGKNQFTRRIILKKGEWKTDLLKGTLTGNFNSSLKLLGLSQRQISQLSSGLQGQIATDKLKKGDRFALLVRREYINGKVTDWGKVEGIHIRSGNKSYYAILADNGRYYPNNPSQQVQTSGFSRQPFPSPMRISSHFNPRRLHPVTRRVAPHKGTDFPVAIGTPIVAPADGVVDHVAYQANGAGKYIRIRHSNGISTVYMHLSRQLVRIGQAVKKGERIALSGNTGRSTGPHLHYELHINGLPVNAMTVKLPGASRTGGSNAMNDKERKAFLTKVKNIEAKLKL